MSAEEILRSLSKKYAAMPSIRLRFSYELKQSGLDFSDQVHGSAVIQKDMYRIDLGDQRIFCDGQSTWTYIPELKEVTIISSSPETSLNLDQLFDLYQSEYVYRVLSREGSTLVLELTPEDKGIDLFKLQVYVNASEMTLLKSHLFYRDGSRHIYTIKDLKPSVARALRSLSLQSNLRDRGHRP